MAPSLASVTLELEWVSMVGCTVSPHTGSSVAVCAPITLLTSMAANILSEDYRIGLTGQGHPFQSKSLFSCCCFLHCIDTHIHALGDCLECWCCCHLTLPGSGLPSCGQSAVSAWPHPVLVQWLLLPWSSPSPEVPHFHFQPSEWLPLAAITIHQG